MPRQWYAGDHMIANETFYWDRPGDPPRSKSVLTMVTRLHAALTTS
jgi:hypothetical protein